jgi:hypothetical protein
MRNSSKKKADKLKEEIMKNYSRMTPIIVAIWSLATFAMPVLAEGDGACRDDIKKLCGDVQPGGGAIADCMKTHASELSPGCKEKFVEGHKKMKEKMDAIKQACDADLKQFCANVTPGQGREFACLRSYDDKISAGCKAALPKGGMMHQHTGMGTHHDDKDNGGKDEDQGGGDPNEAPPAGK